MKNGCIVEKSIKIELAELAIIRLVCNRTDCGGVAEMPVARLSGLTGQVLCPSCNQAFPVKSIGSIGGLKALGVSLANLIGDPSFSVEFAVPDPSPDSA